MPQFLLTEAYVELELDFERRMGTNSKVLREWITHELVSCPYFVWILPPNDIRRK